MLSVIVPVYNVEKYISSALDSLHKQHLIDMEILLIIDGSTDGSEDICQQYVQKDSRFSIHQQKNAGYGAACNMGLNIAKGDYIAIFEPDDTISAKMYQRLYTLATKYKVDILRSSFIYTTEYQIDPSRQSPNIFEPIIEGSTYKMGIKPIDDVLMYGESSYQQLCFDPYSLFKEHPSIWANLYSTEFLNKTRIRFLETPGASFQDSPFHIETFTHAKTLLFVNEAYYYYNIHPNNSISKGKKTFIHLDNLQYLIVEKNILQFLPEYYHAPYMRALLAGILWWLNKNKSFSFVWAYSLKLEDWINKNSWAINKEYSRGETIMIQSYLQKLGRLSQVFYTCYAMVYRLGPEHRALQNKLLKLMKLVSIVSQIIGLTKRVK